MNGRIYTGLAVVAFAVLMAAVPAASTATLKVHVDSVKNGYQFRATRLVTIGLAVDYIGGAQVGQWLAIEPDVIKGGSTIRFAQCFAKADDVVIARASATFRVVRQPDQTPGSAGQN